MLYYFWVFSFHIKSTRTGKKTNKQNLHHIVCVCVCVCVWLLVFLCVFFLQKSKQYIQPEQRAKKEWRNTTHFYPNFRRLCLEGAKDLHVWNWRAKSDLQLSFVIFTIFLFFYQTCCVCLFASLTGKEWLAIVVARTLYFKWWQVCMELKVGCLMVFAGFDALRNVIDEKVRRELGVPRPLLQVGFLPLSKF